MGLTLAVPPSSYSKEQGGKKRFASFSSMRKILYLLLSLNESVENFMSKYPARDFLLLFEVVGRRVGRTRGRCGNSTGETAHSAAKGGTLVNWGGISTSSYVLDIIVDFEQVQGVKFYTYLYMHREMWNSGCYVIWVFPIKYSLNIILNF